MLEIDVVRNLVASVDPKRLTMTERGALIDEGYLTVAGAWTEKALMLNTANKTTSVENPDLAPKIVPVNPALEQQVKEFLEQDVEIPENVKDLNTMVISESTGVCPHCGWDLSLKEEAEVSEEDKQNFIRHILGDQTTRFSKTYNLCGGNLTITFRSRTVEEAEEINSQVNLDRYEVPNMTVMDLGLKLTHYQLACSLFRKETGGTTITYKPLADYPDGVLEQSRVVSIYKDVVKSMSEPVFNMVLNAFRKFEYTCIKLQAQALKSDFWQMTPGQY